MAQVSVLSLLVAILLQGCVATKQSLRCLPDNLSCPRKDPVNEPLQCYTTAELCDGVAFCADRSDEGGAVAALGCDKKTGYGYDFFQCGSPGHEVIYDLRKLCDGINHCRDGLDETTSLCFDKCLLPYYGGCPYSRECISKERDTAICGQCLDGFISYDDTIVGNYQPCFAELLLSGSSALEATGELTVSITLSAPDPNRPFPSTLGLRFPQLREDLVIDLVTIPGGTATVGVDYTSLTRTVTFRAGSEGPLTLTADFNIIDDTSVEDDETYLVKATIRTTDDKHSHSAGLFNIGGKVGSLSATTTLTIIDDDVAVNECATGEHNCHRNAVCIDTEDGFRCKCRKGYKGNGRSCTDIDECKNGDNDCDRQATCTNTNGGYTCACREGYRDQGSKDGPGRRCTDINECSGDNDCDRNANCFNTIGSFRCICRQGFKGDGFTCVRKKSQEDSNEDSGTKSTTSRSTRKSSSTGKTGKSSTTGKTSSRSTRKSSSTGKTTSTGKSSTTGKTSSRSTGSRSTGTKAKSQSTQRSNSRSTSRSTRKTST